MCNFLVLFLTSNAATAAETAAMTAIMAMVVNGKGFELSAEPFVPN